MHCEHFVNKNTDTIFKIDLMSGEVTITSENSIYINNVKENVNEIKFTFVSVKQ